MYADDDYDLAGFCVGVVERDRIIQPDHVRPGDVLLGLASSGPHSNGYSLVRRIVEVSGTALDAPFDGRTLGAALLEPTRIYVKALLDLGRKVQIRALAHITGGGLLENVPRVLPEGCEAVIDLAAWERPRCSAGCRTRAASPSRRCCAPSTAASAWWSASRRRTRTARRPS